MTSTVPASMGEPLSEAEKAAAEAWVTVMNEKEYGGDEFYDAAGYGDEARAVVAAVRTLIEAEQNHPLGDETESAHSIQFDAESESLYCLCGFVPLGDGTHALTNHLMNAATAELRARVGVLEGQLATARALHKPFEAKCFSPARVSKFCEECSGSISDGGDGYEPWPCKTAKALGLDGGGTDAE